MAKTDVAFAVPHLRLAEDSVPTSLDLGLHHGVVSIGVNVLAGDHAEWNV